MEHAQKFIIDNADLIDKQILLDCYGLYKIITIGKCNITKPKFYEFQKLAKYDAWAILGDLNVEIAKQRYIEIVNNIKLNKSNLKSVSTSLNNFDYGNQYTIFDLTKQGKFNELLKCKIIINETDEYNMTLLHWACDRKHNAIVKYLIQIGFDCNLQDIEGCTPLHHCAYSNNKIGYDILIKAGANEYIKNLDNESPIEIHI